MKQLFIKNVRLFKNAIEGPKKKSPTSGIMILLELTELDVTRCLTCLKFKLQMAVSYICCLSVNMKVNLINI